MPEARIRPKRNVTRNFTMSPEDSDQLDVLAALVAPPGEEPNASQAVRVAIRESLEKRQKRRRPAD